MYPIFCPHCHTLILDQPACPACGWQRPLEIGDAGQEVWRAKLGRALPKPQCSTVVGGGYYCLSAEDGTISALDLESGQIAWERPGEAGPAAYALAADGARLLISSVDTRPIPVQGRSLLALDARTSAELWQYATAGHSLSAAAVADGTAYFSSSDGMLHAIDTATGQRRWLAKHTEWGPAAPAAEAGMIVAGGRGDTLIGYASGDGAELWRFPASGWFGGAVVLAEERVYAPCWDGYLYVLEAHTGQQLWKYKGERGEGITSAPAVAGGRVFVGSRVYRNAASQQDKCYALLALRADDGAEVWRFFTEQHIFAAPSVAGETVLFGANDGYCYALDAATGEQRWRVELNGRIVTQPQLVGDLAYVGERHGTVYALRWRAGSQEQMQPPDVYLRHGEYEQAAIVYALSGDLAAAADFYERQLTRPREAAQLYERAGELVKAAALWEQIGELRQARDLYQQAGDRPGVARMLAGLGEPLQAARVYEEIGSLDDAARLYGQAGERMRAAELYRIGGQFGQAAAIWTSLGDWERLVEVLVAGQKPGKAARILEQQGQLERAAELYEAAAQLQQALALRSQLGHWERAADLAFRLGDHAQEALAHEQLGRTLSAAEAYERAARQASAVEPVDEERVAAHYERAAEFYDAAFEDQRSDLCRGELRRYRHLPEISVSGGAQNAFVEHEWNTLKLRVRNTGYGPAANIVTTLRGAFDVDGSTDIARLTPKKTATLELSLRSQREQYGPAVPLEITVTYADMRGGQHSVRRRIPIRVLQQGAASGTTTPLEINIRSDWRSRGAGRAGDATPRQASVAPPRIISAGTEEIDQQQSLLETYRRTLAHLVKQAAQHGGEDFAPTSVANGLYEARNNIQRIKQVLRDWGVAVDDHPDEELVKK